MGRKSQALSSRQKRSTAPSPPTHIREIRIIAGVVSAFALVAATIFLSDRSAWTAPDQLVTVYRLHGCRCAFSWKSELERDGFTVVMREFDSLQLVRKELHTPPEARGCHVGEYMNYFVEGHVDPLALRELSRRHPTALGLSTETSTKADVRHLDITSDETSPVLLVGPNDHKAVWYRPHAARKADAISKEDKS